MKTTQELQKAADALWKARQAYLKALALANVKKEISDLLEEQLQNDLIESKLESVATKAATISLKRNTFVECFDEKAFFAYVAKTKSWDLVSKKPMLAATKLRWEDEIEVPGCRPGTRVDLSITARK